MRARLKSLRSRDNVKTHGIGLTASYLRIRDLLETGDIGLLDREIQSYAQMTTELRQEHLGITEAALAMRALLDGRFAEAEQFATKAISLGQNRRDGMLTQAYATQISLDTPRTESLLRAGTDD